MSSDPHNNSNKENTSVVTYRRNAHFGSSIQYTSSVFVNIQQLQTDLQTQYQHEKDALNELNQRFHQFIDRVQLLESQNSKYLAEVIALRRQSSGDSGIDIQMHERFLHAKSDLSTSRIAKVDYESDLEWFQLQIGIYQQLIDTEQQWKDKRCLKLEQELKQWASELIALRTSYAELERTAGHQYAERDNVFKQYMTLTYDWCNLKKQRRRWDVSVDTLKNYIAFYKNLRSYSTR
jgi:chromosome segregation ATPase